MIKGMNPMQQVKDLQAKMVKMQEELAARTVEASAGGGMVTAVVNGRLDLVSLKIDRQVVDPEDVEMLEDLVVAAVNDGLRKAQDMAAGEMNKLAGGSEHTRPQVAGALLIRRRKPETVRRGQPKGVRRRSSWAQTHTLPSSTNSSED